MTKRLTSKKVARLIDEDIPARWIGLTRYSVWKKRLEVEKEASQALRAQTENLSHNTDDRVREKEEENIILKETVASLNDEITGFKAEVQSLEDTVKQLQNSSNQVKDDTDVSFAGNRSAGPASPSQTQMSSPSPSTGSVYGNANASVGLKLPLC